MNAVKNTDKRIWQERAGDYYSDSISVTADGAISINCGGTVRTLPLRSWHQVAMVSPERGLEVEAAIGVMLNSRDRLHDACVKMESALRRLYAHATSFEGSDLSVDVEAALSAATQALA